jgi:hypothetical protein
VINIEEKNTGLQCVKPIPPYSVLEHMTGRTSLMLFQENILFTSPQGVAFCIVSYLSKAYCEMKRIRKGYIAWNEMRQACYQVSWLPGCVYVITI